MIYHIFDVIEGIIEANKTSDVPSSVLVHCQQGVSRSCAAVIAFIMYKESIDFDTALEKVRKCRSICKPNIGFELQLMDWGRRRAAVYQY